MILRSHLYSSGSQSPASGSARDVLIKDAVFHCGLHSDSYSTHGTPKWLLPSVDRGCGAISCR
jgi:hypothetical protein